jgi:hypothetical protein
MTKPSPGITNDAVIIARMRQSSLATTAPDIPPAPTSTSPNASDANKVESQIAKGILAKLINLLREAK